MSALLRARGGASTTLAASTRLLLACAASAVFHMLLLGAVSIRSPRHSEDSPRPLTARLALAATTPAAQSPPLEALADNAPAAVARHVEVSHDTKIPNTGLPATTGADPVSQMPSHDELSVYDPRPAVEAPLIVDATVYPPQELDVFPRPLVVVSPPYPAVAAPQSLSGRVNLELVIDEYGTVRQATIIEANPEGYFEASALDSFRVVRFTPGERDGRAVRSRLNIVVEFHPPVNAEPQ